MDDFHSYLAKNPIVPFIRQSEFAVRKPWSFPERRLLDYLLIYVQEGRCRFWVEDEPYDFGRGEFCLIQPASLNRLEGLTNTVTPYTHFDIFYNPLREASFPTRAGQTDLSAYAQLQQPRLDEVGPYRVPVRLKPANPGKFRDTFLQVIACWPEPDPLMQVKAQHGMTELVIAMLESVLPAGASVRPAHQPLNWVTSYLSFHLSDPLSVRDMAQRANLSASRFHEVFKLQYGSTPHRYLTEMRVSHACELLRTTDLPQERIAEYCGFSDVHHFSKTFRKLQGVTPRQYRSG